MCVLCPMLVFEVLVVMIGQLLSLQSLPGALKVLCEVLTTDPEGGGSRIPLEQFSFLYNYLAGVDGGLSKEKVAAVMQFLSDEA